MKIDRARFLMLTGAIGGAIAACSTATVPTPDAGNGGQQDATTSDGSSGGDSSTTDAAGDGANKTDASEAATCDDSQGAVGVCGDFLDGGAGPDVADGGDAGLNNCITGLACDAIIANYKPKVAENIITCLVSLPTCEAAGAAEGCATQALQQACPDPTAEASCNQIAAVCGDAGVDAGVTVADCTKLLAGATDAGRAAFVSCMTESACALADVQTCLAQTL